MHTRLFVDCRCVNVFIRVSGGVNCEVILTAKFSHLQNLFACLHKLCISPSGSWGYMWMGSLLLLDTPLLSVALR